MKHCTFNEQWDNHLLFKSITNEIWFYNLIAQPTTYLRKCWFWLDQSSSVTEQLSLIFRETPRAAPGLTTWTRLSGLWRLRGRWAPGRGTCWCSPTSWCTAATATPRTGETWDMRPWHGDMSCDQGEEDVPDTGGSRGGLSHIWHTQVGLWCPSFSLLP